MAKNSTSIVGKLFLLAKGVPRSFQEALYLVVRAVLSTRVIGAVVTKQPRFQGLSPLLPLSLGKRRRREEEKREPGNEVGNKAVSYKEVITQFAKYVAYSEALVK